MSSVALQGALYNALSSHAGLAALVGDRIYDGPPSEVTSPYITFGPSDDVEDDEQCITAEEHFVQLDVWSESNGRKGPAKRIIEQVKDALHRRTVEIDAPYEIVQIEVRGSRVTIDPDGITAHGTIDVRALVEWS